MVKYSSIENSKNIVSVSNVYSKRSERADEQKNVRYVSTAFEADMRLCCVSDLVLSYD